MLAQRYEGHVLVAQITSHLFVALICEILLVPLKHIIHISSPPCNILFFYYSLKKLTFHVCKGLLCLYNKQNNTWLLVDIIQFLFSCSTWKEIPYLYVPMHYSLCLTLAVCWNFSIHIALSWGVTQFRTMACTHLDTPLNSATYLSR